MQICTPSEGFASIRIGSGVMAFQSFHFWQKWDLVTFKTEPPVAHFFEGFRKNKNTLFLHMKYGYFRAKRVAPTAYPVSVRGLDACQ